MTKSLDILSSFLQVSTWLTESLELDDLLPALIKSAIELVPSADAGSLLLYDEKENKLLIRAAYNYGSEVVGLKLSIDSGIAGWVFQNRQATIVNDFSTDYRTHFFPGQDVIAPIKSMIDAPLCVKDKVIGVISFDNLSKTFAFNEEDLRIVRFFANNAAIAIERSRLYEDLKQQNQQLQVLYQKSQEAVKLRNDFLNCATHELRTPLCAIIGFAELLLNTPNQNNNMSNKHHQWLEVIYQSSQDMLNLINGILDLSSLLANRMPLHPKSFHLKHLVEELIQPTKRWIKDKPIDISYMIDGNLPNLYLDQSRLSQILLGLLSNAAKFTKIGIITIEAKAINSDRFFISISDTGIGIKAEHIDLIFEDFGRVDNSTTRDNNGLGIGLSITKRLCQIMGGTISVKSTYDVGSTFTIELPINGSLLAN
ncbi:MAG: GAF domain-containing sensor histidine kinase [Blastocatellia bacterium]|nr:GAF domain-containing sensor histidine kinase [Blastocatellia bacterium]